MFFSAQCSRMRAAGSSGVHRELLPALGEWRVAESWIDPCWSFVGETFWPAVVGERKRSGGFNNKNHKMGNSDSKLNFRKAVVQLTTRNQVRGKMRPTSKDVTHSLTSMLFFVWVEFYEKAGQTAVGSDPC